MRRPIGESRALRKELMTRAFAEVVRRHIEAKRLQPGRVARRAGISRSHLRKLRRAESSPCIFTFLELSHALQVVDDYELWRQVIRQLDVLRDTGGRAQRTSQPDP